MLEVTVDSNGARAGRRRSATCYYDTCHAGQQADKCRDDSMFGDAVETSSSRRSNRTVESVARSGHGKRRTSRSG
jgi:hypothetical protein